MENIIKIRVGKFCFLRQIATPVGAVNGQDERRTSAPPLTAPPGLAFRSSRRASPRGACPPLLDFGRERHRAERSGGQTPTGACPPLPTCKRGDGRRSRPGVSPLVSALTDARRSATSGHFVPPARDERQGRVLAEMYLNLRYVFRQNAPAFKPHETRDGGLYTCRRSLKTGGLFVPFRSQKLRPFSCRCKRGAYRTAPRFPRQPRQQV